MMPDVYTSVRQQLQVAASRRKRHPRKGPQISTRKSPKWQKTYIGPYRITKVLPPSSAVLQRTKVSRAFVVHFDKLNLCTGATPDDWRPATVPDDTVPELDDKTADPPRATETPDAQFERNSINGGGDLRTGRGDCDGLTDGGPDSISVPRNVNSEPLNDAPGCIGRSHRTRRHPSKFSDYVMSCCDGAARRDKRGESPHQTADDETAYRGKRRGTPDRTADDSAARRKKERDAYPDWARDRRRYRHHYRSSPRRRDSSEGGSCPRPRVIDYRTPRR